MVLFCVEVYCLLTYKTNFRDSVLHTSCYGQQIKLDCVTEVFQGNRTRDGSTCSVRVMH